MAPAAPSFPVVQQPDSICLLGLALFFLSVLFVFEYRRSVMSFLSFTCCGGLRKTFSKGNQVYTYIAIRDHDINFSVPKQSAVHNRPYTFRNEDLEVDAKNIKSLWDKTGRFAFDVRRDGRVITSQWVDMNAITGVVHDGTMMTIADTPSIVASNGTLVTYSFYAAGQTPPAPLSSRHQVNVTVSPNFMDWMGTVAPEGSSAANMPFARLVLPSPHDVGMNSMQTCTTVLRDLRTGLLRKILPDLIDITKLLSNVSTVPQSIAFDIIYSLAITQKDTLDTMLQIGARYFEFRPAYCHRDVRGALGAEDKLYFQHGAIPGMAYDEFLSGVVKYLTEHPTEIVVVQTRWDGVPDECQKPTPKELEDYLGRALGDSHIVPGSLADLQASSISQLRQSRKRLVMLSNVDSLSTYSDEAYATVSGDSIVAQCERVLTPDKARGKAFTDIQLQATASNIPGMVTYHVLTASATTSCLLATKAVCDSKTLPWARDHVLSRCGGDQMVVMMNDFIDGATAEIAVELSRKRLATDA